MVLRNRTTGERIADRARLYTTFVGRFFGVMGKNLPEGDAVGIDSCDWVHTAFVPTPLDLIFCRRNGDVLMVVEEIRPFKIGPRVAGSDIVWELPGGTVRRHPVRIGDCLRWESKENG
ncbi:MAG: DUF192 domain-containing protein [Capsulimonadales bacterium]|nr:DUF192 domain-containing protein [Capsulimonadales bacterium]